MAYAQWVVIIIRNFSAATAACKVANLKVTWGKLHATGDKDTEENASKIEGAVLGPGGVGAVQINACGRENAAEGTTGSFDLVDPANGDKVIRHFYWDCPWGSKTNTWAPTDPNYDDQWMCDYSGANLDSGALGNINIKVYKVQV